MKLQLILHTLPHLRWEQVVYRVIRVAQFRAYRAFPRLAARWQRTDDRVPEACADALRTIREVFDNQFAHLNLSPEECDVKLADLSADRFTFLNRTHTIPRPDWNQRYESHLWNYQFHYFGCVVPAALHWIRDGDESAWRRCRQLIESWIDEARIGVSDGWDAYPISLRAVNWIYAYALVAEHECDSMFLQKWRASIYRQLEFLHAHCEFHLLANHLLENAKTLTIGGLFFADDAKGQQWLRDGERLLWREFDEQVLRDGGHYERAPMYHALALAAFLECFALLRAFRTKRNFEWSSHSVDQIATKVRAMAQFLNAMTGADGTFALFNDSAKTDESRPLPLLDAATRIVGADAQPHSLSFSATGYYAWHSADEGESLIVDCGEPSVDYNTAHAHCDLLSYELRLAGKPFIVDSGVHGYGGDRFREYCRSTRAHNTVMFDGREQSEVWGTFRMARRAKINSASAQGDQHTWEFAGSYSPYFDRAFTHTRRIRRDKQSGWSIEDLIDANSSRNFSAESFIHLHPDVKAEIINDGSFTVECQHEHLTVRIVPFEADSVKIVSGADDPIQGWYFPEFGIARPNLTICFSYSVRAGQNFGYKITKQLTTDN